MPALLIIGIAAGVVLLLLVALGTKPGGNSPGGLGGP